MGGSIRRPLLVIASALAVAALAALVFLIRAGGDPADAAAWPMGWELRSSDNGPLFQFLQDVVAGRPLDWSFSPQVFVFPELPLSATAFAIAAGDVYRYYLVVAALNAGALFLALLALVRVLRRDEPLGIGVLRALTAMAPLLVLPLVGTTWMFSFHLAPTYYIGMYLALIASPVLLLVRTTPVRIATGVALALTVASNPLALVFAGPGLVVVLLLGVVRAGWRATRRPAAWVAGVVLAAGLLRLAFSPLQGTSPLTYVDVEVFRGRLAAIGPYFGYQARDPAAAVILSLGIVLAFVCLAAAVIAALAYSRRDGDSDRRLLAVVYLGLVPLGGLVGTLVVLITHYYYFWPVLILPFVLVLLAVPRLAVLTAAASGSAVLLALAFLTGLTSNLGTVDRYFGYRNAETVCLDAAVPGQLGYSTFSDARRLSLTSASGVRLIQIEANGEPSHWLTNRAYARSQAGTFFYVNGRGDETALDVRTLSERFGAPDQVRSCSAGQEVWIYTDPAKRDRIAVFYGA
ncbi:MAG TPA: hypothetical protein VF479_09700 [Pseudolysinimonas sp.]